MKPLAFECKLTDMAKKNRKEKKKVLPQWRVAIAVFGGSAMAGALLGAALGALAGTIFKDDLFGFGVYLGGAGGLAIGYPLGVIPGLMIMKKWLGYTEGSVWAGVIVEIIGSMIFLALSYFISKIWSAIDMQFVVIGYFIIVPLLATVGFVWCGRLLNRLLNRLPR